MEHPIDQKVELRDFPRISWLRTRNAHLIDLAVDAIKNCVNLQSCTWTRDGTCTTELLEQLSACPKLTELELNGHHTYSYSPDALHKFEHLQKLRIIMPSKEVVFALPRLFERNCHHLRSVSIICKVRPFHSFD